MKKIEKEKSNVEKAKFEYNRVTGTFRNELGQEKSMVDANISNEVAATIARRKKHYMEDLWKIDPKKKGPQYVGSRRHLYNEKPKPKKAMPKKIDVPSISEGISKYLYLTKKNVETILPVLQGRVPPPGRVEPPENFGKKLRDPDMDKGLGSLPRKFPIKPTLI